MSDSVVSQALEALTLADVWELAPDNSEMPTRPGIRKSPFREDRKPSFSIFDGLKRYKDQASDEKAGGVWTFVQACRPEWSKQDVARYVVERAGLQWNEGGDRPRKSIAQLGKERREQMRMQRDKLYRDSRASYDPSKVRLNLEKWPGFILRHYNAGLQDTGKRIEQLAAKRGWPVEWVDLLVDMGLVSWPALPWSNKRFPAFRVDAADGTSIGYHQRIWTADDGPAWLYVPYAARKVTNEFTKLLKYHAQVKESPMVPPLPFVLGDPTTATLWILTEGQWDAVTVYGLLGGFDDVFDLPIAVFGLRGAEAGPVTFLAAYGPQLRRRKPHLWLLPDNDNAGAWDGKGKAAGYAAPRPRSFADQLLEYVGRDRHIPVSRTPSHYGKDFNDYYRAAAPSRDTFIGTLNRLNSQWIQSQLTT